MAFNLGKTIAKLLGDKDVQRAVDFYEAVRKSLKVVRGAVVGQVVDLPPIRSNVGSEYWEFRVSGRRLE